jgi:hypothetical protein
MPAAATTEHRPVWPATRGRLLPPFAAVAYVAAVAVEAERGQEAQAWLAATAAAVIAIVVARRLRGVGAVVGWGLAVVVASLGTQKVGAFLDACGAAGVLLCVGGAIVALSRVPSDGGVIPTKHVSPISGIIALTAAWWVAILARVAPSGLAFPGLTEHPSVWSWLAILVSAASLVVSTEWALYARRLELGLVERASAARSVLITLLTASVLIASVSPLRTEAVARLTLAVASACVAAAAVHRDAVWVAQTARRALALGLAGGGVALAGATAVEGRAGDAWVVTAVTAVAALAAGSAVRIVEAPLRPANGLWLDAFTKAADEAPRAEPDDALREVLSALRAPLGLGLPSPEIWTFSPTHQTTVDAAGYLHEREAELPEALVLIAAAEPEGTLRAEVLEALEVRRPDLRPLGLWMAGRRAMLATVIAFDGEMEGLLVLPRGDRIDRVTLEEVRALRCTADRLGAACRARATAARMRARLQDAGNRSAAAEAQIAQLGCEHALDVRRHALTVGLLARAATVGTYSAASRMASQALERRVVAGTPIVVSAFWGIDPANAHRAGPRKNAPLVIVDAATAREHELARWSDEASSPLALADRGMLVILDAAALPDDVQQLIGRTLAAGHGPWQGASRLDVELVITTVGSYSDPREGSNPGGTGPAGPTWGGRPSPALARFMGDAWTEAVVLPRLRDRPEDFRAILTDCLARDGLRIVGRPVGIDASAYARLAEYDFPGDDRELLLVVQRLVSRCRGDTVCAADVDALGLMWEPAQRKKKDPILA